MEKLIELQQDAHDKIIVKLLESEFIFYLKKYFNWRKDISLKRFKKLGTCEHDNFIKYIYNKTK